MKVCTLCGETLPLESFNKNFEKRRGKWYPRAACKGCTADVMRSKRAQYKFKITDEEYQSLLAGGCAVCGTMEELCIDHDHGCCPTERSCGKCIRGVLCQRHNRAEGILRGSVEECLALADYLQNNRTTI